MGLRVTVLQVPAAWNASQAVLTSISESLSAGPATDLVVLPEACLTGYVSPALDFDLSTAAEPIDGPTGQTLAGLAMRHRLTLIGPVVERDGPACFNSTVALDASGARQLHYRKRHPWYPETWATPGAKPMSLMQVHGLKVTTCTCFDLHFVRDEALEVLHAADVLVFPSAWVDDTDSRFTMLTELARDFQLAIVNANWGHGTPAVAGQGGSMIIAPTGEVLVRSDAFRLDAVLFD